jgi:hypothetical protein
MEKIKITKSSVTEELIRSAYIWIDESKKSYEESKTFPVEDYRNRNRENDADRYRAMAHALYLVGRNLGIKFPDDIEEKFKAAE